MIGLINKNIQMYHFSDQHRVILAAGFRRGCGQSVLAHSIAAFLTQQGHSVALVSPERNGVNSNAFTEYMRDALGKTTALQYSLKAEGDDVSSFDRVIYESILPESQDVGACIYITPEFAEDVDLGISCSEAIQFRYKVQAALALRWPDIQTEFTPIHSASLAPQQELLSQTDWMVVRELEQRFLSGSPIETLRHYLRNAKLDGWRPGTRI